MRRCGTIKKTLFLRRQNTVGMTGLSQRAKRVAPSLTLEITAKAKKMKAAGQPVVSFGAGEPDFNTPDYIIRAAKEGLDKGFTKYTPASGTDALKAAIAQKLQKDNGLTYTPQQIVISNGAKHSLYNAFSALVDPGDEVIIPAPYWLTYPELVKLCEGVPVFAQTRSENGFKLTADGLACAITPKTKVVVLNNPCNPTGAVYSEQEIKALAAVLEKTDIYIISDEIYEELVYEGPRPYSVASYSETIKARTIIVNGVSKTYSMTGWRIGYTASDLALAKAMGSMQSHMTSNPNSIAQYAAAEAYTGAEGKIFLAHMKATFDTRRRLMMRLLDEIRPLCYIHPAGAFYVMADVRSVLGKTAPSGRKLGSAHEFSDELLEEQMVAAIPCESFGADGYLRLSYAVGEDDIKEGLRRLAAFVASLK